MRASDEQEELWYQWTPTNAESPAYEDIVRAVDEFRSLDNPPGREATRWLKEEALADHPSTVSYLLVRAGRVEGYFAIASGSVKLTQSHRKALRPEQRSYPVSPMQGASLLAWLAKHRDAEVGGRTLLRYAASIALQVASRQGTVAFVLDPFDESVANVWMDRYGFRRSQTPARGGLLHRLWTPLHSL